MKTFLKYKFILFLILFYLGIALVYTFPLITQFSTHTPGVDEDSATHVWYLWWFRWAVVEGNSNPFFTNWIFYPQLINRTFDIHTWTNAILSLPFQYLFNVVTASNIVLIFSLVFSALGAYLLAFKLTQHKLSSVFSGIIFGFFPYLFAQIEDFHTNLFTVWFFPYYILSLIYLIDKPNYKRAFFSGLVLGLQFLNDWTNTSFLLTAGPTVYLYYLITARKQILNLRTIYYLMVKLLVALIIGSPMIIAAMITIKAGMEPSVPTWVQDFYGADISWYLTPSPQNPFLNQFATARHTSFVESTTYLGLSALSVVIIALIFRFNKFIKSKKLLLPVLIFIIYFFLSLGPSLHLFDKFRTANPNFQPSLFMPFTYFQLIPLIGGIKEPTRIAPIAMLGFAILTSFSFKFLVENLKIKWQIVAGTALAATLLFEYYPGLLNTTNLVVPRIYKDLGQDRDDYAILILPVGFSSGNHIFGVGPIGSLQFMQTEHHKKSFRGTVARIDNKNIDYYRDIPLLHYLADPKSGLQKEDADKERVKNWFVSNKVKFIFIHKDKYVERNLSYNEATDLVEKTLGAKRFYEDPTIIGYKVY